MVVPVNLLQCTPKFAKLKSSSAPVTEIYPYELPFEHFTGWVFHPTTLQGLDCLTSCHVTPSNRDSPLVIADKLLQSKIPGSKLQGTFHPHKLVTYKVNYMEVFANIAHCYIHDIDIRVEKFS